MECIDAIDEAHRAIRLAVDAEAWRLAVGVLPTKGSHIGSRSAQFVLTGIALWLRRLRVQAP
jgi:hypothetical protein